MNVCMSVCVVCMCACLCTSAWMWGEVDLVLEAAQGLGNQTSWILP